MVAHELKSPLASIEQMIYALQVDCKYEALQSCNKLHGRMTVRTKDLLRLIDNLLNLSKLESGTVVFNLERTRGDEIIKDIIEVAAPQAESKNIEVNYVRYIFERIQRNLKYSIFLLLKNSKGLK